MGAGLRAWPEDARNGVDQTGGAPFQSAATARSWFPRAGKANPSVAAHTQSSVAVQSQYSDTEAFIDIMFTARYRRQRARAQCLTLTLVRPGCRQQHAAPLVLGDRHHNPVEVRRVGIPGCELHQG